MHLLRLIFVILSLLCVIQQGNSFITGLPMSIRQEQKDILQEEARVALRYLKAPETKIDELSKSISTASRATDLSPTLITCIIYTESGFKNTAESPKHYKGLMQTPSATFIYSDVDILHGARIFKDKLRITNNNYEDAMMLYKGGRNHEARKYAIETLKLYTQLKRYV